MNEGLVKVKKHRWLNKWCIGVRPFVVEGRVVEVFVKKDDHKSGKIVVKFNDRGKMEYDFVNNEVIQNKVPCLIVPK